MPGRHVLSLVEQSVAAFAAVGHPTDIYAALFSKGVDAADKLAQHVNVQVYPRRTLRALYLVLWALNFFERLNFFIFRCL
jgi:hypothetical protein